MKKHTVTGKCTHPPINRGKKRGRGERVQENVSIMERCGPEQLQAKKRHALAG